MILLSCILLSIISVLFYLKWNVYGYLNNFPGPNGLPFIGNTFQMHHKRPRITLKKWHKQYGDVYVINLPVLLGKAVVVNSYETLCDVLVKRGIVFGGRPSNIRHGHFNEGTGIFPSQPDAKWKILRKLAQKHLRQFGDGLSDLESLVTDVSKDMFDFFEHHMDIPCDPLNEIRDTGLKVWQKAHDGGKDHETGA